MIINFDVEPKAPFLVERSFLCAHLETCKGLDGLQAQSCIHPEPSVPLKSSNRGTSYENRVKPELISIDKPNVRIPKQTASNCSRVDSKGRNRRLLRDEFWGR